MQLCKAALKNPVKVEQLTSFQGAVIDGPLLIQPRAFGDERGWLLKAGTNVTSTKP